MHGAELAAMPIPLTPPAGIVEMPAMAATQPPQVVTVGQRMAERGDAAATLSPLSRPKPRGEWYAGQEPRTTAMPQREQGSTSLIPALSLRVRRLWDWLAPAVIIAAIRKVKGALEREPSVSGPSWFRAWRLGGLDECWSRSVRIVRTAASLGRAPTLTR